MCCQIFLSFFVCSLLLTLSLLHLSLRQGLRKRTWISQIEAKYDYSLFSDERDIFNWTVMTQFIIIPKCARNPGTRSSINLKSKLEVFHFPHISFRQHHGIINLWRTRVSSLNSAHFSLIVSPADWDSAHLKQEVILSRIEFINKRNLKIPEE